jgi:hypothetical protein
MNHKKEKLTRNLIPLNLITLRRKIHCQRVKKIKLIMNKGAHWRGRERSLSKVRGSRKDLVKTKNFQIIIQNEEKIQQITIKEMLEMIFPFTDQLPHLVVKIVTTAALGPEVLLREDLPTVAGEEETITTEIEIQ